MSWKDKLIAYLETVDDEGTETVTKEITETPEEQVTEEITGTEATSSPDLLAEMAAKVEELTAKIALLETKNAELILNGSGTADEDVTPGIDTLGDPANDEGFKELDELDLSLNEKEDEKNG